MQAKSQFLSFDPSTSFGMPSAGQCHIEIDIVTLSTANEGTHEHTKGFHNLLLANFIICVSPNQCFNETNYCVDFCQETCFYIGLLLEMTASH